MSNFLRLLTILFVSVSIISCSDGNNDEPKESSTGIKTSFGTVTTINKKQSSLYFNKDDGATMLEIPGFPPLSLSRSTYKDDVSNPQPYYSWYLRIQTGGELYQLESIRPIEYDRFWESAMSLSNNGHPDLRDPYAYIRTRILGNDNNADETDIYAYGIIKIVKNITKSDKYDKIIGDNIIGVVIEYTTPTTPEFRTH